ncbi:MAG: SGNH/GDSL hydrolase family protein [Bacteroidota bacterium]
MKKYRIIFLLTLLFFGCSSNESTNGQLRRIIFFGDSITELGVKPDGYVSIVRDSLRSAGIDAEIIGAGISGNKVTDLQARMKTDVLEKRPGIVVIYIGINDVWHYQFADRGLSGTPKKNYRTVLSEMITDIQQTGSIVVLCTPSVIGEKYDGTNRWDAMLDDYSAISREIAKEKSCILLDLRKEFLRHLAENNPNNDEKNILTYDGVHLNDRGNRFVAARMVNVLDGLGMFFPHH